MNPPPGSRAERHVRAAAARLAASGFATVVLFGCTPLVTTPRPPVDVREVAVLPIDDVYGGGLPIRWASISGLLGHRPPEQTVPGLLADQLQIQLAAKGFAVTDPARVRAETSSAIPRSPADAARIAREARLVRPVMYARLARWEADQGVSPNFITVKLDLILVDPPTGNPLWEAHWQTRPVPTSGSGSYAVAAERAARTVVAEMTAELKAAPPDSSPP